MALSDRQKKNKAKKSAATRQAKQEAALRDMGIAPREIKAKKANSKRRPMTEAQRKAAAERLEKARAARKVNSTSSSRPAEFSKYKPEDALSYESTKKNIAYLQDLLKSYKAFSESSDWKERSMYLKIETQLHFLKQYINTGHYGSLLYGKNIDKVMKYKTVHMAYDDNGFPKKS